MQEMTTPYFGDKLFRLLPSIYREQDDTGDLLAFLSIPGEVLDELKAAIDAIPTNVNARVCDSRFLPLLAMGINAPFNYNWTEAQKRKSIQEAVARFRRRGTAGYLEQNLRAAGWLGSIGHSSTPQMIWNDDNAILNTGGVSGGTYQSGALVI